MYINLTEEQYTNNLTFGIVRFALFLKVSYANLTNTMEGFNNWENHYDSLSISSIEIENKNYSSVTIIKDYEQQYPLSYHYCKYSETNKSIL